MLILYHHWLSPFARKVRLVLHEKKFEVEERLYFDWERDVSFLSLNPTGKVPVITDGKGLTVSDDTAICEYLEELCPTPTLMPGTPAQRAEVRRLVAWFDQKFYQEVTDLLVNEKLLKRVQGVGAPDSRAVRAGRSNIHLHLEYISWLTDRRKWLAGGQMSLADFTAAAHLSLVDYCDDVPWEAHPVAKEWYARMKSRPCFRPLLSEQIPGIPAPRQYADLDF